MSLQPYLMTPVGFLNSTDISSDVDVEVVSVGFEPHFWSWPKSKDFGTVSKVAEYPQFLILRRGYHSLVFPLSQDINPVIFCYPIQGQATNSISLGLNVRLLMYNWRYPNFSVVYLFLLHQRSLVWNLGLDSLWKHWKNSNSRRKKPKLYPSSGTKCIFSDNPNSGNFLSQIPDSCNVLYREELFTEKYKGKFHKN